MSRTKSSSSWKNRDDRQVELEELQEVLEKSSSIGERVRLGEPGKGFQVLPINFLRHLA